MAPADTLVCDTAQVAAWQSDPAFAYSRELIAPEINVLEWFSRWFGKLLDKIFGNTLVAEYSEVVLICIAVLILVLVIWFVYKKRIKSVIRRHQQGGENSIKYGNIEIFPDKYGVTVAGKKLELNRKEYDILVYFMNRPGRLVNKSTLAESVWGDHIDQVDNFDFIYAQIKNLRKRLKEAGATPELKAVYGFGYKMVVE